MKNTLLILTLTMSACSVSVRVPGNRFHTPEVLGKKKVGASLGKAGMGKVEFTDDYTRRHALAQNASLHYSKSLHGQLSYGVSPNADLGIFYNSDSSLSLFGKANFLTGDFGSSQKYFVSGVLSGGFSSESKTADKTALSDNAEIDMSFWNTDAGILIGARASDYFLYYAGLYYLSMNYSSEHRIDLVTKEEKGVITSPTATYGFELRISKHLSLTAEGAYSKLGISSDKSDFIATDKKRDIHSWGVRFNIL